MRIPRPDGVLPTAASHNGMIDALAEQGKISVLGGSSRAMVASGGRVLFFDHEETYGRITGGSNPYTWRYVFQDPSGRWVDGNDGVIPAFEVNGYANVPAGKVVRMHPGSASDMRFQFRRSGTSFECFAPCDACVEGLMPASLFVQDGFAAGSGWQWSYRLTHVRGTNRWAMDPDTYGLTEPTPARVMYPAKGQPWPGCAGAVAFSRLPYAYEATCGSDESGPYFRVARLFNQAYDIDESGRPVPCTSPVSYISPDAWGGPFGPYPINAYSPKLRDIGCTDGDVPIYTGALTPPAGHADPTASAGPVRLTWAPPAKLPSLSTAVCMPRCMPCSSQQVPSVFMVEDQFGTWPATLDVLPEGTPYVSWSAFGVADVSQCDNTISGFSTCMTDGNGTVPNRVGYRYQIRCYKDYSGRFEVRRYFRMRAPATSPRVPCGGPIYINEFYLPSGANVQDSSYADLSGFDMDNPDWTATLGGSAYQDPVSPKVRITSPFSAKDPLPGDYACAVFQPGTPLVNGFVTRPHWMWSTELRVYDRLGGELLAKSRNDGLGRFWAAFRKGEFPYTRYVEIDPPTGRWEKAAGDVPIVSGGKQPCPDWTVAAGYSAGEGSFVGERVADGEFGISNSSWGGYWYQDGFPRNAYGNVLTLSAPMGAIALSRIWRDGRPLRYWVGSATLDVANYMGVAASTVSPFCTDDQAAAGLCACDCVPISGKITAVFVWSAGRLSFCLAGNTGLGCGNPRNLGGKWLDLTYDVDGSGTLNVTVVKPEIPSRCRSNCCIYGLYQNDIPQTAGLGSVSFLPALNVIYELTGGDWPAGMAGTYTLTE